MVQTNHKPKPPVIQVPVTNRLDEEPTSDGPAIEDAFPVVDKAAFHGILGEIVEMIDPETEADPVAVLAQLLVAFGNLAGREAHFVVGAQRHYLNLFCVLVGATSAGAKGSSLQIVRHILQQIDREWTFDRIKSGLTSGEGLIYHVRDPRTERRPIRATSTGPVTDYQEQEIDPGVSDKRLLVIEEEFSRTITNMNRQGNTLSAVIRNAWDTGTLSTLTKNSPNEATEAHISIIAHITKYDLQRDLSKTDSGNGFVNRFLWIAARRSKILPHGGNVLRLRWGEIADHIRQARDIARSVTQEKPMERDAEANAIWASIYEEMTSGPPGMLGSILGRATPQVMKLACLYAILELSTVVRAEHLNAALALWDYCERTARYVFGEAPADGPEAKLMDALRNSPNGMERSKIVAEVFSNNIKRPTLDQLLARLLTEQKIHKAPRPPAGGRGRPPEVWRAGMARERNTAGRERNERTGRA